MENGSYTVEANDMGAVRLMTGKPFVACLHINTYNPQTLALLAELGAQRWVMPVEMSRQMLSDMLAVRPYGMETEVFADGRLPLAFSARFSLPPAITTCPRTTASFAASIMPAD